MTIHPRLGNIIEAVLDHRQYRCSEDYLIQIQRDLATEFDIESIDELLNWMRNRYFIDGNKVDERTGMELAQYYFSPVQYDDSNLWKRIIAHRGASYDAPENTLAAVNLAWSHGARMVEVDVHLTSDHQIVVIHDQDTKRLFDQNKVINRSSYNELRELHLSDYRVFSNERIPLLKDVLNTIPREGKLVIEIKSNEDIVPPLKEQLSKVDLAPEQIEIISFDFDIVSYSKKQMPQYRTLWLLDLDYFWPSWLIFISAKKLRDKLLEHSLDGVNVWAGKMLNQEFIDVFQDSGLSVYAWTVNDPNMASHLVSMGIDAVTTDRPRYIFEHLSNHVKVN